MQNKALDKLHLLVYGLSIVGWGLLFYTLMLYAQVRPEMSTVLTKFHNIELNRSWSDHVYKELLLLLWFCSIISLLNILLNWYLKVAYKQRFRLSLVLLFVISSTTMLMVFLFHPIINNI